MGARAPIASSVYVSIRLRGHQLRLAARPRAPRERGDDVIREEPVRRSRVERHARSVWGFRRLSFGAGRGEVAAMTRTLSARGGRSRSVSSTERAFFEGSFRSSRSCSSKPVEPGETRKLDSVGMVIETPAGWTVAGRAELTSTEARTGRGACGLRSWRRDVAERSQGSAAPDRNRRAGDLAAFPDVADEDWRARGGASSFRCERRARRRRGCRADASRCGARSDERLCAERANQDAEGTEQLFTSVRVVDRS